MASNATRLFSARTVSSFSGAAFYLCEPSRPPLLPPPQDSTLLLKYGLSLPEKRSRSVAWREHNSTIVDMKLAAAVCLLISVRRRRSKDFAAFFEETPEKMLPNMVPGSASRAIRAYSPACITLLACGK